MQEKHSQKLKNVSPEFNKIYWCLCLSVVYLSLTTKNELIRHWTKSGQRVLLQCYTAIAAD